MCKADSGPITRPCVHALILAQGQEHSCPENRSLPRLSLGLRYYLHMASRIGWEPETMPTAKHCAHRERGTPAFQTSRQAPHQKHGSKVPYPPYGFTDLPGPQKTRHRIPLNRRRSYRFRRWFRPPFEDLHWRQGYLRRCLLCSLQNWSPDCPGWSR